MSAELPPPNVPSPQPGRSSTLWTTLARGAVPLAIACCLSLALGGWTMSVGVWVDPYGMVIPGAAGLFAGMLIGFLQRHPRRALGLIPLGAAGMTTALLGLALDSGPQWCFALMYFAVAFVTLPLSFLVGRARSEAEQFMILGLVVAPMAFVWLVRVVVEQLEWSAPPWVFVTLAGLGTVLAFWRLRAEAIEQLTEIILWPVYRIRAYGPGKKTFPLHGPVLVVSNHTAWFDPLWLGKVILRRIIPMMGSGFYDLPGLRWLMVYVVGAIRVQESGFRRDVPELDEAVRALDQGECVVIFPEGRVRRSAEVSLRQFGQGVWHILQRRPLTPVVVCWIEGGWGSYFSYFRGPPMKNKPYDFWRRIRIGMSEPQVLDAALLAEHRATRDHLMRACLDARKLLGLEDVAVAESDAPEQDEA